LTVALAGLAALPRRIRSRGVAPKHRRAWR
jgi:hypothetical protein